MAHKGDENLIPYNSETARNAQKKSVAKRKQNAYDRMVFINSIERIFNTKVFVSEPKREAARRAGFDMGKREPLPYVLLVGEISKNGVKSIIDIAKAGGLTFDQSADGLGGKNNPLNVANTQKMPAERIKEIGEALEREC